MKIYTLVRCQSKCANLYQKENIGVSIISYNISTIKGEHSCKFTELSLKKKGK